MSLVRLSKDSKSSFFIGLTWFSVEDSQKVIRWKPSRDEKYFARIGSDKNRQIGTTDLEVEKSSKSGAAFLANVVPDDKKVFVLKVLDSVHETELFWLVGLDNGRVLPGTDTYGDYEKIQDDLNGFFAIYGDEFKLETELTVPIDANTLQIEKEIKLQRFKGMGLVYAAAIGLLLIGGAIKAFDIYSQSIERSKAERERARIEALHASKPKIDAVEIKEKIRQIELKKLIERIGSYNSSELLQIILEERNGTPTSINGWTPESLHVQNIYKNGAAQYEIQKRFQRRKGHLSSLRDSNEAEEYKVEFNKNGNSSILFKTVNAHSKPIGSDKLDLIPSESKSDFDLRDITQFYRLALNLPQAEELNLGKEAMAVASQINQKTSLLGIKASEFTVRGSGLDLLDKLFIFIGDNSHSIVVNSVDIEFKFPPTWTIKASRYVK